ncbi:MAG: Rubrerythrin domain-containing protein [Sporanaerobacter sp.]|jgi:rubrerythrin|uniref:ferritin-like domain-containing protein n=1 Tax=Sporanaerobacter sp. TaxID=2010183 RepID=UPI003A10077C
MDYGYYDYGYYIGLVKRLEEYIQNELEDSDYYKGLAKLAPTELSKEIILRLSEDEAMHAENLQRTYYMITGRYYTIEPIEPVVISDYEDALKQRVLAETNDYKKYGEEYLMAPNKYLKDLFFNTRTVEAQHAMRISILFEED